MIQKPTSPKIELIRNDDYNNDHTYRDKIDFGINWNIYYPFISRYKKDLELVVYKYAEIHIRFGYQTYGVRIRLGRAPYSNYKDYVKFVKAKRKEHEDKF